MLSWADRRKLLYMGTLLLIVLVALGVSAYVVFFRNVPTCEDGKQNGTELGIDCGGSCARVCAPEIEPLIVYWARPLKVTPGLYDAVAFIKNPNTQAGAREAIYKFKIYDEENILVSERVGKTYLYPNEEVIIFEGGIRTGFRIPKRAFFEFAPGIGFDALPEREQGQPSVSARNQVLDVLDGAPRLSATISNNSPFEVKNVEVTALLFDKDDNVVGASKTLLDSIPRNSSKDVRFTWKEQFVAPPVKIQITPRVNPF